MIRPLIALTAILALASVASAAPSLTFTSTAVGGGLTAYDFTFHSNDALNSSAFAAITFTAASGVNQVNAFVTNEVDSKANSDLFGGIGGSGYSAAQDSWFYSPWIDNLVSQTGYTSNAAGSSAGGMAKSATTYGISGGSGTGSHITDTLFAHVVSSGIVSWSGALSRNSIDTQVSGTTAPVPEPATVTALAAGTLALLSQRRRRV